MAKIVVLYNDAGGGHKSAALALQEIGVQANWDVELFNPYKHFVNELDLVHKYFRVSAEELYNRHIARKNSSLFSQVVMAGVFATNIALYSNKITLCLAQHWRENSPDLIISVTPYINKQIAASILDLPRKINFATLVTDYKECARGVWISSRQQNIICCSEKLVAQARNRRIPEQQIHKLSGMIIGQRYYSVLAQSKQELRAKFNLDPSLTTGLIIFGSHGSADSLQIVRDLQDFAQPLQLVVVCGHNQELRSQLQSLSLKHKLSVLGFVSNVEEYMRCADFLIGKPGGLCISEAAVVGLPMIVKRNLHTLLQERYNANWIEENGLGIVVKSFKTIKHELERLLQNLSFYQNNLATINNRAIFELPQILQNLLK